LRGLVASVKQGEILMYTITSMTRIEIQVDGEEPDTLAIAPDL
jgi:hypothetical protein